MADKDKDKKKDAEPAPEPKPEAAPSKKGLPIKTIAIVAVLMIVEAAAVVFVLGLFGGPKESGAHVDPKQLHDDEGNKTQEIQIVDDRFQNLTSGKVWIWDTAVFVQVKNKNAEQVEKVLEQRGAEIKEGIGQIISRAQHAQLKEPERQSINRQLTVFLEKVVGAEDDGKPLIERVLIPKCRGYPSDF